MPEHLGINKLDSPVAIITGDPERVEHLASLFGGVLLSKKRGFLCYAITRQEVTITLLATGIGSPSTAIVVEELIELGANIIIRIGTCGALQNEICVGDIVISTGSVRDEGTSKQYINTIYPAIPDLFLTHALITKTKEIVSVNVHHGITHCKDAYYSEKVQKTINELRTKARWLTWKKANVLATEMEASALFIVGSLRKIKTAGIFVSVSSQTTTKDTQQTFEELIKIIFLAVNENQTIRSTFPALVASQPNTSFLSQI